MYEARTTGRSCVLCHDSRSLWLATKPFVTLTGAVSGQPGTTAESGATAE